MANKSLGVFRLSPFRLVILQRCRDEGGLGDVPKPNNLPTLIGAGLVPETIWWSARSEGLRPMKGK